MNKTNLLARAAFSTSKERELDYQYQYCHIGLVSPEMIRSWAERQLPNGEIVGCVSKPHTVDFQMHQPERDGLFCERIFGPIKSNVCGCGVLHDKEEEKTNYCKECGVEITDSRVRRHRMGYIDLQCSVTHAWYLKQRPSYIARVLNQSSKSINSLVYYQSCLVRKIMPKPTLLRVSKIPFPVYKEEIKKKVALFDVPLELYQLDWDNGWRSALEFYLSLKWFKIVEEREISTGGDAIKQLLKQLDLNSTIKYYENKSTLLAKDRSNQQIWDPRLWMDSSRNSSISSKISKLTKKTNEQQQVNNIKEQSVALLFQRLGLLRNLLKAKVSPEWMVLSCLPVLPPTLRPMVEVKQGQFITSDLNSLYKIVIYRNNQLAWITKTCVPAMILNMQKRLLQKGVDALLANGIGAMPLTDKNWRAYKSFSDIIKGKKGRFRENLLGKRVDYSGRSVIVVGPSLSLNQCGLPREMAVELFQPFLIQKLIAKRLARNPKAAKILLKIQEPIIWKVLATIVQEHLVILNRAPTLHRLGMQAFQPLLVKERAIHLHPLVCAGFNADFDGDQIAVHVPLGLKAQAEARMLMLPFLNLISPASGEAITVPSQDMLLGLYALTLTNNSVLCKDRVSINSENHLQTTRLRWPMFSKYSDVLTAYNQRILCCYSRIWLRWIPNTCIVNSSVYGMPLENQYEPFLKSKRLSIYEHTQIINNIHILDSQQMQQLYICTTVGRVLFNQQIEQVLQSDSSNNTIEKHSLIMQD